MTQRWAFACHDSNNNFLDPTASVSDRQIVDQDHDARARDAAGGAVLRGRRHADPAAAAPARAARALPEVTHRVRVPP